MRYQEGIHGIFRNTEIKPNTVSLQRAQSDFLRENPEEQARLAANRKLLLPILIGIIGFGICLALHIENVAMIIGAIAIAATMIIYCQLYTKPVYPKSEKHPAINCVIVVVACLIVVVYNVMCLVGPLKEHTDGDNGTALCVVVGWVGISKFITLLIHGIRMNIKCSEQTDAYCVGYTDTISRTNKTSHVVSRCVYEFNHNGETYYIRGNKESNFQSRLTSIGFTEKIRYDPNNPEYCMIKKFELASFVEAVIIGGLCCVFAFSGLFANLTNPKQYRYNNTSIPTNNKGTASVEYVDDNTIIINANDNDLIEETTEETTTTETEPEEPGYTDEKIASIVGSDEFFVFTCPVVEKDGDFAFFGEVPGLITTVLENKELEVGDEVIFIFDKNSHFWNYKLEDGESYLGDRSPEKLGMISEDGKFILTDEYIEFFYGDNFKANEKRFSRKTATTLTIEDDEYEYDYNLSSGTDIYYWDINPGDKFYVLEGSKYICLVKADLYILPENK